MQNSKRKTINCEINITEKDFRQQVIDLAVLLGYRTYFSWTSLHSPKGFPDLILVKTLEDGITVVLAPELKSEKGKPTMSQIEWLELLGKTAGIYSFIWIPSQIDDIVEVLQARGLSDVIKVWKRHALFAKKHFGLNLSKN